jgi:hypothetical protein
MYCVEFFKNKVRERLRVALERVSQLEDELSQNKDEVSVFCILKKNT